MAGNLKELVVLKDENAISVFEKKILSVNNLWTEKRKDTFSNQGATQRFTYLLFKEAD